MTGEREERIFSLYEPQKTQSKIIKNFTAENKNFDGDKTTEIF